MSAASSDLTPFPSASLRTGLARKGVEFISEGHPFGDAQGRLSDSQPRRVGPKDSGLLRRALPFFISLLEAPRWKGQVLVDRQKGLLAHNRRSSACRCG